MEFSKRKKLRLPEYRYSTANAYFITFCTVNRENLFWSDTETVICSPQDIPLSDYGRIAEEAIKQICRRYPAVSVDHYAVMPNHIHLLLQIHTDLNGRPMVAPTVSTVIQQLKGAVSKRAGFSLWQKGFYDHVVRGEKDYQEVWEYIEGNPMRWIQDKLYIE